MGRIKARFFGTPHLALFGASVFFTSALNEISFVQAADATAVLKLQ